MIRLPNVLCAVALATMAVAPVAAQSGEERPSEAGVNVGGTGPGGADGTKKKNRCLTRYNEQTGQNERTGRCAGFLLGGAGFLGGGAGLGALTVLAISVPVFASSSSSTESP